MNPPTEPLSVELLTAAVTHALRDRKDVAYSRLLLNERRWRSALEGRDIEFVRGLLVHLVHPDDMNLILKNAFVSNYGFSDYSVFMIPQDHYDQKLMLELDFQFENTQRIESLLRSGDITVLPSDGDYQFWYTAEVLKGEGHGKLEKLICPQEHHGSWQLRDDISIRVQDGDITIVASTTTRPLVECEIIPLLVSKYGVKVSNEGLRKRIDTLLAQAIKLEKRANYFEEVCRRNSR